MQTVSRCTHAMVSAGLTDTRGKELFGMCGRGHVYSCVGYVSSGRWSGVGICRMSFPELFLHVFSDTKCFGRQSHSIFRLYDKHVPCHATQPCGVLWACGTENSRGHGQRRRGKRWCQRCGTMSFTKTRELCGGQQRAACLHEFDKRVMMRWLACAPLRC